MLYPHADVDPDIVTFHNPHSYVEMHVLMSRNTMTSSRDDAIPSRDTITLLPDDVITFSYRPAAWAATKARRKIGPMAVGGSGSEGGASSGRSLLLLLCEGEGNWTLALLLSSDGKTLLTTHRNLTTSTLWNFTTTGS